MSGFRKSGHIWSEKMEDQWQKIIIVSVYTCSMSLNRPLHVYLHDNSTNIVEIITANVHTDSIDAPSHRNTSTGFILGDVPRHCIIHVLTVIKEAMYKVRMYCDIWVCTLLLIYCVSIMCTVSTCFFVCIHACTQIWVITFCHWSSILSCYTPNWSVKCDTWPDNRLMKHCHNRIGMHHKISSIPFWQIVKLNSKAKVFAALQDKSVY